MFSTQSNGETNHSGPRDVTFQRCVNLGSINFILPNFQLSQDIPSPDTLVMTVPPDRIVRSWTSFIIQKWSSLHYLPRVGGVRIILDTFHFYISVTVNTRFITLQLFSSNWGHQDFPPLQPYEDKYQLLHNSSTSNIQTSRMDQGFTSCHVISSFRKLLFYFSANGNSTKEETHWVRLEFQIMLKWKWCHKQLVAN